MAGEHGGTGHTTRDSHGYPIVLRGGIWVYNNTVWAGGEVLQHSGDPVAPYDLPSGNIHNQYWDANSAAWRRWERQQERQNGTTGGTTSPGTSSSRGNAANPGNSGGGGDLMSLIHQAGFQGSAAQTMYAIVLAESGGNARAHNGNSSTGDNSYGLAQINMLGSMGPARLREYGLSSNDDLFDPLTNLRVAYRLSNGGRNFSAWTTFTRGTYQQYMGQSGAAVTNGGSGSTSDGSGLGGSGSQHLSGADYSQALGSLSGILKAVPELRGLLQQAVSGGWSTTKFVQAVQGSHWYRQHGQDARSFISLQYSDPGTYRDQLRAAERSISQTASRTGAALSSEELQALAIRSITEGWDSESMTRIVGGQIDAQHGPLQGTFAQYYTDLQQLYANYGLPISDVMLRQRAKNVADTNGDMLDTYKTSAVSSAQGLYPSLSSALAQGQTVKDIADPYVQTMGKLLEVDPSNIGLDDPTIKKALQGSTVTTAGKSTAISTPLYQFENQLRGDPRWQYTDNARDTVMSALHKVGQDFGYTG